MKTLVTKSFASTSVTQRAALGICALALAAAPWVSHGQSVGINFAGRQWTSSSTTPVTLDPSDSAGVVSQQNWNNVFLDGADSGGMAQLNIGNANAGVVSDNSGTATSLTFSYAKGGNATEWSVDQATHTGNQQLMDGYWDIQSASGAINLGNISYSLYDVYVYVSADNNDRTAGVNLNSSAQTYLLTDANGYDYGQPLIQATATSEGSATSGHYVLYQNMTGSSLEIDLFNYGQDVGVAGIQIAAVPEPTTIMFSVLGLTLAGLMRRRS